MSAHERATNRAVRKTRGRLKALGRKKETLDGIVMKSINETNREVIIKRQ